MSASEQKILRHSLLGDGPEKIIAIHNFWDNRKEYEPMWPYLDKDAFTYIFADVRGYGESADIIGEYTAKEVAGDVIALADHLEWDRFHLVGHSMTGMVVQRAAVDAKDRVKSVVALTPVPATGIQLDQEFSEFVVRVVSDRKAMYDYFSTSIPMFSKKYANFRTNRAWESSITDVKIAYFKMWNNTDFSQETKGLDTPMLVVLAEYDTEFNEGVKPFWEGWYQNCEIVMCKNATHHVTEDTPVFVASAIENFVAKHT